MERSLRPRTDIVCALVALSLGSAVFARPPVQLRTGSVTTADGYLEILPDEYGAWAQPFATGGFGPNADRFNPAGAAAVQPVGFTSGFFLFGPNGQRELLSDSADWQATTDGAAVPSPPFSADTSLSRAIVTPNVATDFNGDGINDTANSAFRVFAPGGGTDLGFALRQRITAVSSSVAFMQQNYTITNNGTQPISLVMVRSFDGDLLWTGDFSTDSVGTSSNGDPAGKSVFMQEVNQPGQSVNLSLGLQGNAYFGGKNGVDPDGAGGSPAYNFGSDTEIWESIGMPGGWVNNIAGVGYNTNGQSGATPVGSVAPRDGFIGMDILLDIPAGGSKEFSVLHTYGQTTPAPIPEPAALGAIGLAALTLVRRRSHW